MSGIAKTYTPKTKIKIKANLTKFKTLVVLSVDTHLYTFSVRVCSFGTKNSCFRKLSQRRNNIPYELCVDEEPVRAGRLLGLEISPLVVNGACEALPVNDGTFKAVVYKTEEMCDISSPPFPSMGSIFVQNPSDICRILYIWLIWHQVNMNSLTLCFIFS